MLERGTCAGEICLSVIKISTTAMVLIFAAQYNHLNQLKNIKACFISPEISTSVICGAGWTEGLKFSPCDSNMQPNWKPLPSRDICAWGLLILEAWILKSNRTVFECKFCQFSQVYFLINHAHESYKFLIGKAGSTQWFVGLHAKNKKKSITVLLRMWNEHL